MCGSMLLPEAKSSSLGICVASIVGSLARRRFFLISTACLRAELVTLRLDSPSRGWGVVCSRRAGPEVLIGDKLLTDERGAYHPSRFCEKPAIAFLLHRELSYECDEEGVDKAGQERHPEEEFEGFHSRWPQVIRISMSLMPIKGVTMPPRPYLSILSRSSWLADWAL